MSDTLPFFKYHPDPLKTKLIIQKTSICPLCKKERHYFYKAPYYIVEETKKDIGKICPWCLADGTAERSALCIFSKNCNFESNVSIENQQEVLYRTPGYFPWQHTNWLTHCGEPCAFIGYVDLEYLQKNKIDVQDDLENIARSKKNTVASILSSLENNYIYQGYLFKCVQCGKYRISVDSD